MTDATPSQPATTPESRQALAPAHGSAIEWHYAPATGVLGKRRNGEWEQGDGGWAKHHENMAEFLRLRASGDLVLKETVNYGHPHFHGHTGRVEVYSPNVVAQRPADENQPK